MEINPLDAKKWQAHWQLTSAIASFKQESNAFHQMLERNLQANEVTSAASPTPTAITTLPSPQGDNKGADNLADLLLRMIKLGGPA